MDNIERVADELEALAEQGDPELDPRAHAVVDGLSRRERGALARLFRQRAAHMRELAELHTAEVEEIEAEIRRREGNQ